MADDPAAGTTEPGTPDPAAPAAAAAAALATGGDPPAPAGGWQAGLSAETAGALAPKNFATIEDFGKAYLSLETVIGKKGVIVPGDKATSEELDAFHTELGRPKTAEDYKITLGKGVQQTETDKAFTAAMLPVFHAAGLNQGTVDKLVEGFNAFTGAQGTVASEDAEAADEKLKLDLHAKWGANLDKNEAIASFAAKEFGPPELLDKLNTALGDVGLMEMMFNIGSRMIGDGGLIGVGGGFVSTPEQAQIKLAELKEDKEFNKALLDRDHPEHKQAVDKWSALGDLATGMKKAG